MKRTAVHLIIATVIWAALVFGALMVLYHAARVQTEYPNRCFDNSDRWYTREVVE